jgi:glycosyltransferase involved in cell wall biosynthesis
LATNWGIRTARGDHIALLDSDDVWLPDKLAKQVAFLDRHPEYAMVTGNGVYRDDANKLLVSERRARRMERHDMTLPDLFMKSTIKTSTILARRHVFEENMLDPALKSSIHLDFAFRVLMKHRIAFMNETLIRLGRQKDARISAAEERRQLFNLIVIHKLLASHPQAAEIIGESNVRARIAYRHYRLGRLYLKEGNWAAASERFRSACYYRPGSLKYRIYKWRADFLSALSLRHADDSILAAKLQGFTSRIQKKFCQPPFLKWMTSELGASPSIHGAASKHATSRRSPVKTNAIEHRFYIKRFFSAGLGYTIKDLFRVSKALRAWNVSFLLARYGFATPPVVAAGETRRCGFLADSFLVTEEVNAPTIPQYLSTHHGHRSAPALRKKRRLVRSLAAEIGRMHLIGIIHGDLLPGNILIDDSGEPATFFFLDNDRTRKFARMTIGNLMIRNLIQLGRFPLPGITLTDRLRFFKAYIEQNPVFRGKERELLARIVQKTRSRVLKIECADDPDAKNLSFRLLMSGKR